MQARAGVHKVADGECRSDSRGGMGGSEQRLTNGRAIMPQALDDN